MSPPSPLLLAIHGPTAEAHELHTGQSGSFEVAMRALAEARSQRRRVLVASRLTRSSCRSLVTLVDRLLVHGVAGWAVTWPWIDADSRPAAPRTVPRLGIAVPHALRAVQRAVRRGMPVVTVGVPLCVLGPFAARRLPSVRVRGTGVYPQVCGSCPARSACPGVDPWYLDRFGDEELRAVPEVPMASLDPGLTEGLARAVKASEGSAS